MSNLLAVFRLRLLVNISADFNEVDDQLNEAIEQVRASL